MILKLTVSNYALIENAEISFSPGMTIITGETGAGKSIFLGALSLLTGVRADTSVLTDKSRKCVIEGEFGISGYGLEHFFTTHDLDFADNTLIRREISPDGKSRSFINDTPVTLPTLRELGGYLIDIHSQHETLTLRNSDFQMMVTDSCADNGGTLESYRKLYDLYMEGQSHLDRLRQEALKAKNDEDYNRFLLTEISDARLSPGEQESMENELQILNHSEEIKNLLSHVSNSLEGNESNLLASIGSIVTLVRNVSKYMPQADSLAERISSLHIDLKDITREIESLERSVNFDPSRLEQVSSRLDTIYRLQQKHKVSSTDELISIGNELSGKIAGAESLDAQIQELEKQTELRRKTLEKSASELRKGREKTIPEMESTLKKMLSEVGMKHAIFKALLKPMQSGIFRRNGSDEIEFQFSANKGIEYRELGKVASGGELSRLMLCIKSMMARKTGLPTILFDEIDTGISGETALRVGGIIRSMADERQVLVITHLPQVAARGTDHWYVYKETGKRTTTRIRQLKHDERILEIAKMLSGESPSDAALTNARELLNV